MTRSIPMEVPEEIARPQHAWTPLECARLAGMWRDGLSAQQIARALGGQMTTNMVIGKAHRLGLPKRPSPIKRRDEGASKGRGG